MLACYLIIALKYTLRESRQLNAYVYYTSQIQLTIQKCIFKPKQVWVPCSPCLLLFIRCYAHNIISVFPCPGRINHELFSIPPLSLWLCFDFQASKGRLHRHEKCNSDVVAGCLHGRENRNPKPISPSISIRLWVGYIFVLHGWVPTSQPRRNKR